MTDEHKQDEPKPSDPGKDDLASIGQGMSLGAGIGVALGAGIGAAFGNIGIGVAIGVAIGPAMGMMVARANQR